MSNPENQTNSNKYAKKNRQTWRKAKAFLSRSYPDYEKKKENLPEANGIYRCFPNGYFLLTDTHLNFYVGNQDPSHYSFVSTHIGNISSVCANMRKHTNQYLLRLGIMLTLLGAVLFSFMIVFEKWFWMAVSILAFGGGIVAIVAALTFARVVTYKINFGGITITGSSHGFVSDRKVWDNSMTIVHNERPNDYNFIQFVEKINVRIALLKERGTYAFENCLEDLEEYDE